jgi:periplasmic protein TonB
MYRNRIARVVSRVPIHGEYIPDMPSTLKLLACAMLLASSACIDRQQAQKAIDAVQTDGAKPDVMPVMLNRELPFRYPPALYARRVQGNVTLHIHIDSTGIVWPESTSVVESSGYPALDSSAVAGSRELRFEPATTKGRPVSVSLKLPVFFRHPNGKPLAGDTVLQPSRPKPAP